MPWFATEQKGNSFPKFSAEVGPRMVNGLVPNLPPISTPRFHGRYLRLLKMPRRTSPQQTTRRKFRQSNSVSSSIPPDPSGQATQHDDCAAKAVPKGLRWRVLRGVHCLSEGLHSAVRPIRVGTKPLMRPPGNPPLPPPADRNFPV